jgi:hypothetical protein
MRLKFVIGFALLLALLAVPMMAMAQTAPAAPAPTIANCTALDPDDSLAYVLRLGGGPRGADLLAVYVCTGFVTTVVGDTEAEFDTDCASTIAIYKVESTGRQGSWNIPGKICAGDILSLRTGGTGHYVIYSTSGETATAALPPIIVGGA